MTSGGRHSFFPPSSYKYHIHISLSPFNSDLIPYASSSHQHASPPPSPPSHLNKHIRPSSSSTIEGAAAAPHGTPSAAGHLPPYTVDAAQRAAAAPAATTSSSGYACNWNFFPPSAVFGSDRGGIDPSARGIYNADDGAKQHGCVNDGSDIVINFDLFHCHQGKLMLSFACLGSNSLADLIDFLHPTFIIGTSALCPLFALSSLRNHQAQPPAATSFFGGKLL